MKLLLVTALALGLLLVPMAVLPTASADLGNMITGDPNCGATPSSGSRFTGYYDDSQPDLYFIMIGGESWCSKTATSSGTGSGIVVFVFSPRGGASVWWTQATNAGCQIGVNYNLPDRNHSFIVPCPAGAPDPGWGHVPLL